MKTLRNYFSSYRKALDAFVQHLNKANLQFEKDFAKANNAQTVDTLSTSIVNVKICVEHIIKDIAEKSEMIQRDLVEPLELYYKHYLSTN